MNTKRTRNSAATKTQVSAALLALVLIGGFQNCAAPFEANSLTDASSFSASSQDRDSSGTLGPETLPNGQEPKDRVESQPPQAPATPTRGETPVVNQPPAQSSDPMAQEPVGFASVEGKTTGGAGGSEVVVSSLNDLKRFAAQAGPVIIKISGTISGNEAVEVSSDKTIIGVGATAKLSGIGLKIGKSSAFGKIGNVIIRNVTFEKAIAPTDSVAITQGAHHVWVDHCDFSSDRDKGKDFYDGLLDITHGAQYITVSWNKFHDHFKNSLVGHSDSNRGVDTGRFTITYHHNLFERIGSRNPSVRFRRVHVFNNYFKDLGEYGIASRMGADVMVENNYFENVPQPIKADTSLSSIAGRVSRASTNIYKGSGPDSITLDESTWLPPYRYLLDGAIDVPEIVRRNAGVRP